LILKDQGSLTGLQPTPIEQPQFRGISVTQWRKQCSTAQSISIAGCQTVTRALPGVYTLPGSYPSRTATTRKMCFSNGCCCWQSLGLSYGFSCSINRTRIETLVILLT